MAVDYKKYDFKVFENIVTVHTGLMELKMFPKVMELIEQTEEIKAQVKSKKTRVAVVGEFNRGKTTLINAVLGSEILPADIRPTTAAVNRITYGNTPRAYINFADGSCMETDIDNLSEHITKLTDESLETALKVKEAVVEFPSIICSNYVDIIDTPGMNDDELMSGITLEQLADIDIAVTAICASIPCSDTEGKFIAKLVESAEISDIVIVITKIDYIRESERGKLKAALTERVKEKVLAVLSEEHDGEDEVIKKYHMIFDNPKVFAVSSMDALDALKTNDAALFEKSGIGELNDKLPQIILGNRNNSVIFKAAKSIKNISKEYKKVFEQITSSKEMHSDINMIHNNINRYITDFESIIGNLCSAEIGSMNEKLAGYISDMFAECIVTKRHSSFKIRRKVKKRRRKVMKFVNDLLNYIVWKNIVDAAMQSMKKSLDIMCGKILSEARRFEYTNEIDDIVRKARMSEISATECRPHFVYKWRASPVPPFRICKMGNKKILEYIRDAALQSLSAAGDDMQKKVNEIIRHEVMPDIRSKIIVPFRNEIDEYFGRLDRDFNNAHKERINTAKRVGNTIDNVVKELERISTELKKELWGNIN